MSEIERHNPTPELSSPPELDRQSYDSLARIATSFVNKHGEPLFLEAIASETSNNKYLNFSSSESESKIPLGYQDQKSLFVNPDKVFGLPKTEIGKVVDYTIAKDDMPFPVNCDSVSLQVFSFSESVLPFVSNTGDSDLSQMPTQIIKVDFLYDEVSAHADNGVSDFDGGEWLSVMILPSEDASVSHSLRIRDYGSWGASIPSQSSDFYKAMNAMTAGTYAELLNTYTQSYDFSFAAKNKLFYEKFIAEGNDPSELPEWWGDEEYDFVEGQLLDGYVGSNGAAVLQQLIETAINYGEPNQEA